MQRWTWLSKHDLSRITRAPQLQNQEEVIQSYVPRQPARWFGLSVPVLCMQRWRRRHKACPWAAPRLLGNMPNKRQCWTQCCKRWIGDSCKVYRRGEREGTGDWPGKAHAVVTLPGGTPSRSKSLGRDTERGNAHSTERTVGFGGRSTELRQSQEGWQARTARLFCLGQSTKDGMPWEENRIYLVGKQRLQQREGNEVLLKSYICKYFFL